MNVVFTCGGTGGHINPAIAVANSWKERHPDDNILFIGGRGNMEEKLVLSKKEGGDWALRNLPPEYHPLIMDAMREYSESAEVVYDSALARRYAEYVSGRIAQ